MKNLLGLVSVFLLLSCGNTNSQQNQAASDNTQTEPNGEQLYRVNCSQCHLPATNLVGPALAGVESRWKDKQLLYAFVKNSEEVIEKDAYAKELFLKWKQTPMLPHPQLTDADIDAIFEYCNQAALPK